MKKVAEALQKQADELGEQIEQLHNWTGSHVDLFGYPDEWEHIGRVPTSDYPDAVKTNEPI